VKNNSTIKEKYLIRILQFLVLMLLVYEAVSLLKPGITLDNMLDNNGEPKVIYLFTFLLPFLLYIHLYWQAAWAFVVLSALLNYFSDKYFFQVQNLFSFSQYNLVRMISTVNIIFLLLSIILMQKFYKNVNYSQYFLSQFLRKKKK
jgi:hypothetical protein